jgi:hypothetical protein
LAAANKPDYDDDSRLSGGGISRQHFPVGNRLENEKVMRTVLRFVWLEWREGMTLPQAARLKKFSAANG